jgi:hypothetical protein
LPCTGTLEIIGDGATKIGDKVYACSVDVVGPKTSSR